MPRHRVLPARHSVSQMLCGVVLICCGFGEGGGIVAQGKRSASTRLRPPIGGNAGVAGGRGLNKLPAGPA